MSTKYKNIRISDATYNKLAKLGDLQDTFDTVIAKLIPNSATNSEYLKRNPEKIGVL